jgi:Zn finger protein HypA/HybF involved in hydrogenase expression
MKGASIIIKCPNCEADMVPLVDGIFQCPTCKKIIKGKAEKEKEKEGETVGELLDGEVFHTKANLNKKYEICEKGITIAKTPRRWIAALICHTPYLKTSKYIRLSWWKKEIYQHGGFFSIKNPDVLKNIIIALEKFASSFDEFWAWKGSFEKKSKEERNIFEDERLKILKYRIIENLTCPNCSKKLKKEKSHYECPYCGEIIILEGYNQPIFDIDPKDLPLEFSTNFPINYYLATAGITVSWLMAEWKAIAVIYSNDNPNKKWLRFYTWIRDLQSLLKFGPSGAQMTWTAKKGVGSPNIYEKKEIRLLIHALKKLELELGWNKTNE